MIRIKNTAETFCFSGILLVRLSEKCAKGAKIWYNRDGEGAEKMKYMEKRDRAQMSFLPECVEDDVDEDNPVRVIDAFVDRKSTKICPKTRFQNEFSDKLCICFTVLIEIPGGGFTCPLGGFNRVRGGSK